MSALKFVELCSSDKLSSRLYTQKQKGQFCDLNLIFGNDRIPVHSCIVSSASSYVQRVLSSSVDKVMSPKADVFVDVSNEEKEQFCKECAEKIVQFMYCCQIQVEESHILHICSLSKVMEIPELVTLSQTSLKNISTNEEVPQVKTNSDVNENVELEGVPNELNHKSGELNNGKSCSEQEWTNLDSTSLTCPKCKSNFTNVIMLQQHCNTHFGKFYTCYVCNYSTLKVPHLLKHLKDANHLETVCSLCLFEAESNVTLRDHMNEHDHAQPFFCRTCMNRFQTRTALNSHIIKHSSGTPFVCTVCGRGFKWKQGLQNHMFIHTSIKNHLCDQCGYSTAHLKSFQDHKIIHSGKKFKCPISACEFSSARKDSVKHHLSTHSKEKSYQCEVCGRAFSQAKNLRRHAAIHDPLAEIVQCPFCSFKTMRSDKFKDHLRSCYKKRKNDLPPKTKNMKVNVNVGNDQEPVPNLPQKSKPLREVVHPTNNETDSNKTLYLTVSSSNTTDSPAAELIGSETMSVTEEISSVDFDVTPLVITTTEGNVISLSQDQVNFVVCNSNHVDLQSFSTGNVEIADLNTSTSFEQCDKPLLLQLQVQDAVGSEVEISCGSNETLSPAPKAFSLDNYVKRLLRKRTEAMITDQNPTDVVPEVNESHKSENFICLPLSYDENGLIPKSCAERDNLLSNQLNVLLAPNDVMLSSSEGEAC